MYNCEIPNCVPEYYREMQEREEHEYAIKFSRNEYYAESREKLDDAYERGYPVLYFGGYEECRKCTKKFDAQRDADDDFSLVICYDNDCYNNLKKIYGELL